MISDRPRVVQSFRFGSATTNPYLVQLVDALECPTRGFSWRLVLLGRYDVLHLHWPELLMRGANPVKTALRRALVIALLVRMRLSRIAVVRTFHNLAAHEAGGRVEKALLDALDRATTVGVLLNDSQPAAGTVILPPVRVIPHGHYRDWFVGSPAVEVAPGRLLDFGLIRPYKGAEDLVTAFRALDFADSTLHVVGRPNTRRLADELTALAGGDGRIELTFEYVDDSRLAVEVGQAELVVLPYRSMYNSGALLLALSLGRPVLVPRNDVTISLGLEVGPGWVTTFEGRLDARSLEAGIRAARRSRSAVPDLSARDWAPIARQHTELYRDAMRAARSGEHR